MRGVETTDMSNMSEKILDKANIDGDTWVLLKTVRHGPSFTASGRGTISTKTTYSVELAVNTIHLSDKDAAMGHLGNMDKSNKQRFWMTNKQDAVKYFNELTKKAATVERSGVEAMNRLFGVAI